MWHPLPLPPPPPPAHAVMHHPLNAYPDASHGIGIRRRASLIPGREDFDKTYIPRGDSMLDVLSCRSDDGRTPLPPMHTVNVHKTLPGMRKPLQLPPVRGKPVSPDRFVDRHERERRKAAEAAEMRDAKERIKIQTHKEKEKGEKVDKEEQQQQQQKREKNKKILSRPTAKPKGPRPPPWEIESGKRGTAKSRTRSERDTTAAAAVVVPEAHVHNLLHENGNIAIVDTETGRDLHYNTHHAMRKPVDNKASSTTSFVDRHARERREQGHLGAAGPGTRIERDRAQFQYPDLQGRRRRAGRDAIESPTTHSSSSSAVCNCDGG
ncbi:hypothetical protein K504DRAFT_497750 [Pleomassaria siparia CBS 279.74]|uniref:Uncharacterized protein n=1 Tax=Pleomassaria siparia CBS 279.74 TaxID=1314801 RepID=A0A6G1KJA2_9PLEO|nr:hypothetical protein K504DRAFT_497750 [Pleomassaria siparia CBS 279.74]